MQPQPPPIPDDSRRRRCQNLARYCWLSVVIGFGANIIIKLVLASKPRSASLLNGAVAPALFVSGIVSGIIALFGMRRHGRKGILGPTLTGIGLWVLLIVLAFVCVIIVKRHDVHASSTVLAPATHTPGATRFENRENGFSFDVPEGFQPFSPAEIPRGCICAYFKPKAGEAFRMLVVKNLGGRISREHLKSKDLPAGESLTSLFWRGLAVDAVAVRGALRGVDFLFLNIQIPLRREAIQIDFGAPYSASLDLRPIAEQVLASLEGETNW